ncbi:hypothetical protein [Aerosakkonema funiforme]|uniref:hypothetical protein n=1 Tax=Aerosakkonema funiforme TaxID=1246630 RepID=UPI0035B7E1D4
MVNCQLRKFGYEHNYDNYEFNKEQVLGELRRFLLSVMQLAIDHNYVTLEDKEKFIAPAFPDRVKSAIVV